MIEYVFLAQFAMTTENRSLSLDNPNVPTMPSVYSWQRGSNVTNGRQWQSSIGGYSSGPSIKKEDMEEME